MAWRDVNSGSGGGWRQSKKKKKEEPSYTETLEKRIGNYETRFGMMGEEPPKKTDTKTKLLKVLDYMDRPRNAVVNAIQDVSKGENGVLQGLSEGFRGQERANMSDFLDPNMNKYARGALGFIGDVALDPLTYLTFGAGGVAKKGVQEAGEAGLKAVAKPDTYMKLFGKDVANVSPIGKAIGQSAVGKAASPVIKAAADTVGPMFNRSYKKGQGSVGRDSAIDLIDAESRRTSGEADIFLNSKEFKNLKLINDDAAKKVTDLIELPKNVDMTKRGVVNQPGMRQFFKDSDLTRRQIEPGQALDPRPPFRESDNLNKFGDTTGLPMGAPRNALNEVADALEQAKLPEQGTLWDVSKRQKHTVYDDGTRINESMIASMDPKVAELKAQMDEMVEGRARMLADKWETAGKHLTDENSHFLTGWDKKNAVFDTTKIGMSGKRKNVMSTVGGKPSKRKLRSMAKDTLTDDNAWENYGKGILLTNADYKKLLNEYNAAYKAAREKASQQLDEINFWGGASENTAKSQLRRQYDDIRNAKKNPTKQDSLWDFEDALPQLPKSINKLFNQIEERAWDDIDINDVNRMLQAVPTETANKLKDAIMLGIKQGEVDKGLKRQLFKEVNKASKFGKQQLTERELIAMAKAEGKTVDFDTAKALFRVNRMSKQTLLKDRAAGVEFDPLSNYVTHYYHNPPEVIRQLQNDYALYVSQLNPKQRFQKHRSWETLQDFENFAARQGVKLDPEKDIRKLAALREMEGQRQRGIAVLYKGILESGDSAIRDISKAPNDWVQLPVKAFEGKAVDPEIARHIEMMNKTFETDAGLKAWDDYFNGVQNIWKGLVTTSFPFHLRNGLGNMYNNWLAGVKNPTLYAMATAVQKGTTAKFLINGVEMSGDDIMTAFRKQGLEGFGLYHGETTRTTLKKIEDELGLTKRGLKNLNPLSSEFAPVRGSRWFGNKVETNAKLAHFIDKLQKGFTPEEASASVRKYLFDYSDLTEAEKKIRGVIPFWTWTRKNLPVQLESLVKQPGKPNAVTHLIDNMQNTSGMEEDGMPDWLRNDMAIPIMVKEDGTQVYLSPNLPLANLNMLLGGKDQLRDMAGMITPLAKAPLELAMNRQFFSDQPVEKYEGATAKYGGFEMPAKYAYLLNQLGAIPRNVAAIGHDVMDSQNPNAKSLSKSTLPENPDISGLQQTLLGSLLRDVNPERTRAIELIQREKQLADFRKKLEEVEGKEVPELTKKKKTTSTWRQSERGR